MAQTKRYRRVLLKLSGESLTKGDTFGLDGSVLQALAHTIAKVASQQTEITIMIGGGNIWRYADHQELPIERATSDYMGMLGMVMNAIALQDAIEQAGTPCRVQSAIELPKVAEPYIRRRAIRHLEKGRVVIFAAGVGQSYFTGDTGAALRALEIGADVLLKGTKVDGIYDRDPVKHPKAKRFATISYQEILDRQLKIMDATAVALCRENKLPIVVFDMFKPGNLEAVVAGKKIGTKVSEQ